MAGNENATAFLTEDILTNILLRLPTVVCIARFRCVCKSWRNLLSDPQFIRKIIFFQNSSDVKALQILITGKEKAFLDSRDISYSLHSYDTLRPIFAANAAGDLPSFPYKPRHPSAIMFSPRIVGCCDGLFCISELVKSNDMTDIILWNPTTSETKYLPLCNSLCPFPNGLEVLQEMIGFGFDPQTNDYKVVRIVRWERIGTVSYYDCEDIRPAQRSYEVRDPEFTYAEVYSLKNDSWKRLPDASDEIVGMELIRQRDVSRNEKCYWFQCEGRSFAIVCFDMSEEAFEVVTSSLLSSSSSSLPYPVSDDWWHHTEFCYMLKESFVVAMRYNGRYDWPMEVWALMKYGVAESWTKLFTFRTPLRIHYYLEVWKDGTHICSPQIDRRVGEAECVREYDGVYVFDPATEELGDPLDVQGRTWPFEAHTYTPTLVPLSDLEE